MVVRVSDGDSSYTIQQGSVSIEAAKNITLLSIDGPITLENGGGMVELSDGKLSVMGTTVSIEGSSVNIAGQTAEMMGGGGGGAAVASSAKLVSNVAAPQPVSAMLLAATTGTGLGIALAATQAPGSGKTTTKPVATAAAVATSEKAKETGRFITAAEGQGIVGVAKDWEKAKVPYVSPGNTKRGADCSGSTSAIYAEAGLGYGHKGTAGFSDVVGTDANFVKGKHYFKKVYTPQVGDVGLWSNGKKKEEARGHMAIFDANAGFTDSPKNKQPGNLWSASSPTSDRDFGPAKISFYDNKNNYGTVTWYRYWKAQ